jgi:hypothetical protein
MRRETTTKKKKKEKKRKKRQRSFKKTSARPAGCTTSFSTMGSIIMGLFY